MQNIFDSKLEYLKGVGTQRAALLSLELQVFTYGDLLQKYPFRHEDRTEFHLIGRINEEMAAVQIKGVIRNIHKIGEGKAMRVSATLHDHTGMVELVWFKGIDWILKNLREEQQYVVYGKPALYGSRFNIAHPEIEPLNAAHGQAPRYLQPIYHTTEKMKKRWLDSKSLSKIMQALLEACYKHIPETLPQYLIERYELISKMKAIIAIHFPKNIAELEKAKARLKFEELFYIQLKILQQKTSKKVLSHGFVFTKMSLLNTFYKEHLPFDLTGAQKRVIREIYQDMTSGRQMNRLLQGDVGSGKTIVGFVCMLMAIDNDTQACLMAPTEILAEQHYVGLKPFADALGIPIAKITGSSKKKERTLLLGQLAEGSLKIVVGTHALIEDTVQFKQLGICVIDEQHRFGVAQRAKLWQKNEHTPPHVLVMTATPIPRTLAMTLYGDLDVSVIDELPPGRKPIRTVHRYDSDRLRVFGFMKEEIEKGRQIYVVYPLIDESETLDYKDLTDGYESIVRAFPPPEYQVSIVHGRMKAPDRDFEMQRFIRQETQIMVATTVIEVGVNVPNASVMVIESSERFGLSQLHQLRGRVGRGADQSFCILMTGYKMSQDSKLRIQTMEQTNNGFEIADVDLKLRGPGDMMGTQQSGVLDLLVADLSKDARILQEARNCVEQLLERDADLQLPEHEPILKHISSLKNSNSLWSRIS